MGEELPSRPFFPVQEEVRRLFQELIHQPWGGQGSPATSHWQPHVDMCETPEAIIVEVELPGVRREDVRIEIEGDFLLITGERHTTAEHQQRNYYRLERLYGRFAAPASAVQYGGSRGDPGRVRCWHSDHHTSQARALIAPLRGIAERGYGEPV